MTLNEFRNRLKQLKAYKAELERRLKRSPMRSGNDIDWNKVFNEYIPETSYQKQSYPVIPETPDSPYSPFGKQLEKMTEAEFYALYQRLIREGKNDLAKILITSFHKAH